MRAAEVRAGFAAILTEHRPTHLVHVGAHEGEEVEGYLAAGVPRITLVEPIPTLASQLRTRYSAHPAVTVVEAACSIVAGLATLHIPARTNMATLEASAAADSTRSIKVFTRRLEDIAPDADAAVIDVQGHEWSVLAAAPWDTLRLLMVETCTVDDPTLSPPYDTTVDYMAAKGFHEIASFPRDYDWIQRWAYGKTTRTGAEVRDVVFLRNPDA